MTQSTGTMKRIMIDRDKCESCMNCVLACMVKHNDAGDTIYDLDLTDPKNQSRNHIELDHEGKPVPIVCRHCEEPECVMTCMSGAMSKDPETGYVTHNKEQCASCFMCVMSCPYGVLSPDRETGTLVMKCDMCEGLDEPQCAAHCPTGALYLVEVDI